MMDLFFQFKKNIQNEYNLNIIEFLYHNKILYPNRWMRIYFKPYNLEALSSSNEVYEYDNWFYSNSAIEYSDINVLIILSKDNINKYVMDFDIDYKNKNYRNSSVISYNKVQKD